jgi:ankyrin repeat protein
MTDQKWLYFDPGDDADDAFPLYYASLGGFYDVAEHLVARHPEHIDARGDSIGGCIARKHFQVAELLYRNGADVDVHDNDKDTPQREAYRAGVPDIVSWLLNHGRM